jgi:hypothetical protein
MTVREAERRARKRNASEQPVRRSQRILTFKDWCALNSISISTGQRLIRAGKVRVVRLSKRRFGIGEDDNAEFQSRNSEGGNAQ